MDVAEGVRGALDGLKAKHLLERRDSFTPSDMVWVWVDSFHDQRTGYEFGVNAAGTLFDDVGRAHGPGRVLTPYRSPAGLPAE